MHSRLFAAFAGLALTLSCSTSGPDGVPTAATGLGQSSAVAAVVCPTVDQTRAQIVALFPAGDLRGEAVARYDAILRAVRANDLPGAQAAMFRLVDYALGKYSQGLLIGGRRSEAQLGMSNLLNGLYCTVALPPPNFPPAAFGDAGAIGVITPTSPLTQIVTPTQFAGIEVQPAAAPTTTVIAVFRLPDSPAPLNTPLDQYPSFFEFQASPAVTLFQDAVVGTCQVANFPDVIYARLKLGHNLANNGFELLPRVTPPFLNCTTIGPNGLTGDPTVNGGCCLGGTTKNFSPFGAVDTLTMLDAASLVTIGGSPNSPVPSNQLPAIQVRTPLGKPVPGLAVTFAIPAGSEGSVSGAQQVTNANGVAKLGGWTLGPGQLPNTVTATATPLPGSSVARNGSLFTAILP